MHDQFLPSVSRGQANPTKNGPPFPGARGRAAFPSLLTPQHGDTVDFDLNSSSIPIANFWRPYSFVNRSRIDRKSSHEHSIASQFVSKCEAMDGDPGRTQQVRFGRLAEPNQRRVHQVAFAR